MADVDLADGDRGIVVDAEPALVGVGGLLDVHPAHRERDGGRGNQTLHSDLPLSNGIFPHGISVDKSTTFYTVVNYSFLRLGCAIFGLWGIHF